MLDDYRNAGGRCDAFVSVGMLEHVGTHDYPTPGRLLDRTLGPDGRGLLHFIGRNHPEPRHQAAGRDEPVDEVDQPCATPSTSRSAWFSRETGSLSRSATSPVLPRWGGVLFTFSLVWSKRSLSAA